MGPTTRSQDSSHRGLDIDRDSPQPGSRFTSARWQMTAPVQDLDTDEAPTSGTPDPEDEPSLRYTFTKVGERRFKNTVIDRHYDVKFDMNTEGENLKTDTHVCPT